MSLINQMLADLEARRGGNVRNVDHALDGLAPTPAGRRARRRRGRVAAVVLVGGIALAGGLLWQFRLAPVAPPSPATLSASASAAPTVVAAPIPSAPMPATPPTEPPAPANKLPVLIADTRPTPGVEVAPAPAVDPANAANAAIPASAAAAVPVADLPPPPPLPVTKNLPASVPTPVASQAQETPPLVVKHAASPTSRQACLPAAPVGAPMVEQAGSFQRNPASNGLPPAEALAYARALKTLEQGSTAGMGSFVAAHPAFAEARERLALALFDAGRGSEAEVVLRVGLAASPKSSRFAEMLGHALLARGDAAGAQAVLRPAAPALSTHPDYHALLAAAEQGTSAHALAATRYRGLLQLQPGNGRWWVGLGISLRALGDPQQAVIAFDRALDDRSLPEPLRAYAARETVRLKER